MPSLVSISDRPLSKDGVNQTDVEKYSKIDPSDGPENDVIQESTKTAVVTKSNKNGEEFSVEQLTQETTEEIESSHNNVATTSLTSPPNKKRRVTPNDDSASKQDQQKKVNQMTLSSFFFQGDKNKKSTTTSTPPSNSTGKKKTLLSRKHPRTDDDDEDEFSSTRPKEDLSTTIISNGGSNNENEIEIIDLESDNNDDQGNSSEETNCMEKELKTDEKNQRTAVGASKVMDPSITDAASDVSITANTAKAKVTQTTLSTASITNFLTPSAVKKKRSSPTTLATAGKSSINKKITTKKTATSTARKSPKRQSTTSTKKSVKSELESSSSHFSPTKVIAKKTLSLEELPEERRILLQSHNIMKARYLNRASELVTQYRDDGIEEEKDFYDGTLDLLQPITDESELKLLENTSASAETETNCKEFPTQVLTNMGLLIEGRYDSFVCFLFFSFF
jgi:hypothetical protein